MTLSGLLSLLTPTMVRPEEVPFSPASEKRSLRPGLENALWEMPLSFCPLPLYFLSLEASREVVLRNQGDQLGGGLWVGHHWLSPSCPWQGSG